MELAATHEREAYCTLLSDKNENELMEELASLRPLALDLGKSVTCPICIDYFEDAQQLLCGHVFCAKCVCGLLGMKRPRCAICNRNTNKRGIRAAPIDFNHVISRLREIEATIDSVSPPPLRPTATPVCNDGFKATVGAALTMRRRASAPAAMHPGRASTTLSLPSALSESGQDGCVLCPSREPSVSDKNGSMFRGRLTPVADTSMRGISIHEYCGDYAEGVYEVNSEFWNVATALKKSQRTSCHYPSCGEKHASTRCAAEGCERRYHFACALYDGAKRIDDGFKLFCRDHAEVAPKVDDAIFAELLTSPDAPVYKEHDNNCFECGNGGRLLMCDTCVRSVHLACAGLLHIPYGEFNCTVCADAEEPSDCTPLSTPNGTPDATHMPMGRGSRTSSCTLTPPRPKRKQAANKKMFGSKSGSKRARRTSAISDRELESISRWKPVLCATGLDEGQKVLLKGVAGVQRTIIKKDFDKRVTHMVINAFLPENTPIRTMKLCKAIAAGVVLVCFKWIEDSAGWVGSWKDVDGYIHPWTRKGRIPLFKNLHFHFGNLGSKLKDKNDFACIVKLGGGEVVTRDPTIDASASGSKLVLVEAGNMCNGKSRNGRRASLVSLVLSIPGAEVVDPVWILDRCTAQLP